MNAQQWRQVRELHESGMSIKGITRHLGIARNTVRKALASDGPPSDGRRPGDSIADVYEARIAEVLAEDPTVSAPEIARRIGWDRSMTVLRERVRALRGVNGVAEAAPARPSGRLPADVTSFVGRREELVQLRRLLRTHRLVTLVGAGGVGKSRLAVRAAHQDRRAFPDGAYLIELAALRDPALLAQTVVDQLGLADQAGSRDALPVLEEHVARRRLLLVLDNCEHLLEGCAELALRLRAAGPGLRLLATSRQALCVPGEHRLEVGPLPVEDEGAAAVTLFGQRAAAVVPGFEVGPGNDTVVRSICRHLDGVPLAIELAAIQLRVLSADALERRLAHRMVDLEATLPAAPARHRSVQAAMDWSYDLCSPLERQVWAAAAVFAGGFDLEACEAVCGPGVAGPTVLQAVGGLVDKSILRREEVHGHVRFRMLEPIAEAGLAHLDAPDLARHRLAHREWCVDLVSRLAAEWFGPDQMAWCRRIRAEHANLRAALDHAVGDRKGAPAALRLVGEPWFLWAVLSQTEHRHWLRRALAADSRPRLERARALGTYGLVATLQGDRAAATPALDECERLARALGDAQTFAYARHLQGLVEFFGGDFPAAHHLFAEALAAYHDDGAPPGLLGALRVQIGLLNVFDDDLAGAEEHFEELARQCRDEGEQWLLAYATAGLAFGDLARGDPDRAAERALTAFRTIFEFNDTIGVSLTLDLLAWAESARANSHRSAVLLGAASGMWRSFGQQLYGSGHWMAERERFEGQARAALGEAAFRAAEARGGALPRDELVRFACGPAGGEAPGQHGLAPGLTPREREVVAMVAAGLTNREIAARLAVSARTVEGHVANALRKLGFERRAQLAAWAATGGRPF